MIIYSKHRRSDLKLRISQFEPFTVKNSFLKFESNVKNELLISKFSSSYVFITQLLIMGEF